MRKILFILLMSAISLQLLAQTDVDSTKTHSNKYIGISGGFAISSLRDMGTSPLFYTGFLPSLKIDYTNYQEKHLWNIKFTSLNGIYISLATDETHTASGNIFDFEFSYFSNYEDYGQAFRKYLGVSANNYSAIRVNSSFMNAAFAFDNISNINLNYKLEWDFTRKEKQKKLFWLINYTRKEKKYLLSAKFGVPIFALIYRPGYTYIGNGTLNNDIIFIDYEWKYKVFPGMNTDIGISRILNNGNQMKLSYYWDFMTTGKMSENRLDKAKHMLLFTLIFKLN